MGGTNTIQLSKDSALFSAKPQDKYVVGAVSGGVDSSVAAVRSTQFCTGFRRVTWFLQWLQNWWRRFMWMKHVSKDSMTGISTHILWCTLIMFKLMIMNMQPCLNIYYICCSWLLSAIFCTMVVLKWDLSTSFFFEALVHKAIGSGVPMTAFDESRWGNSCTETNSANEPLKHKLPFGVFGTRISLIM